MKSIKFKLHSFVDLITNSSSETFIQCTSSTQDAIKEIVNHLLIANNITNVTCDDIFDIDVSGDEVEITNKTSSGDYSIVAQKLSSLVNTYEIESRYDG